MKSKREPLEVEMKGSGTGPLKRERRRIACCVSTLRFFLNQTVCFSFWIIIQKQPKVQHLNTHSVKKEICGKHEAGFVLRGGGTCGRTARAFACSKNGCWAHCPPTQPPTRAHLRACSTVRRDFHRIALLPAMGARVVFIVNRGWHTNP